MDYLQIIKILNDSNINYETYKTNEVIYITFQKRGNKKVINHLKSCNVILKSFISYSWKDITTGIYLCRIEITNQSK